MRLKKEFEFIWKCIKEILTIKKYKIISLVFGLAVFGFLYYLFVAKVADNNIWISVMMSGPAFVTFSIVTILIISTLSAILLSIQMYKFSNYNKMEGKGIFGFIGSGVAAFGVGCPTCGAYLFGLIGLPLALLYLPFKGLELQVFGIVVLVVSIYFTGKSIDGVCKLT